MILDNTLLDSYLFPTFLLFLFYRYLNFKHELQGYLKGTWNITSSAACPRASITVLKCHDQSNVVRKGVFSPSTSTSRSFNKENQESGGR